MTANTPSPCKAIRQSGQRKNLRCLGLLTAAIVLSVSTPALAADLELKVTNIESGTGEILISLYSNEEAFRSEPLKTHRQAAQTGDIAVLLNDLPVGDYAVMLFHDINSNGKLDTNLIGIPKEPWGGSLNGTRVFGAPKWQDVKFTLPAEGVSVSIELQ